MRFVKLAGRLRAELFAEAKNLLNTENVAGVNRVIATDALGNPTAPIPTQFTPTGGYDQRSIQVGLKMTF